MLSPSETMSLNLDKLPSELPVSWCYSPETWEEAGMKHCDILDCTVETPEYEIYFGDGSDESDILLGSLGLWGYWFYVCEAHKDWISAHCDSEPLGEPIN